MKGDYEEFHALKTVKNKPNSKPIAGLWAGNLKQDGWGEIPQFGVFCR